MAGPSRALFSLCGWAAAAILAGCSGKPDAPARAGGPPAAAPAAPGVKRGEAGLSATPTPPPPLPADPGPAAAGAKGKRDDARRGSARWAIRLGGTKAESGRAVAVGPDGGLTVTGLFRDEVDFGGTKFTARGADGFLARLGPDGAIRWARQLGSPGDDIADALAVDGKGNAIVAGSFSEDMNIGDGALRSSGADDMFVASFDPDGRRRWAKRMGGVAVDGADDVAVSASGAVAVIGSYTGYVDLGGGHELVGTGDTDILLVVLDADGVVRWARGWSSQGPDEGRAVGFDAAGNLFVLAEFSRAIDFGGGPIESVGNRDLVVAKLDPTGKHLWSRRFGSNLDELGVGLAVDPAGSVLVTGSFDDTLDFGDGVMKTAGRSDVFVAKLAPDGHTMWSRKLGNTDEDIGVSVATDPFGNAYVAGWFWRSLDLRGAPVPSAGKKDAFLWALDPSGEGLWLESFGGVEDDYGRGVAATGDAVYFTGTFHKTIRFGATELTAVDTPNARLALGDAFVAALRR